jgi:hypothetical protein
VVLSNRLRLWQTIQSDLRNAAAEIPVSNSYDEILSRARQELSLEEQLRLVNDLCQPLSAANGKHRISELKGLGKTIWKGIDPNEYVRKERDSWNG